MVPSLDLCKLGSELSDEVGAGISTMVSRGTFLQFNNNKRITE